MFWGRENLVKTGEIKMVLELEVIRRMLRENCPKIRGINFPSGFIVETKNNDELVFIIDKEKSVVSNMQTNESAFEGWILALKTNIKEYKNSKFYLKWEEPLKVDDPHYQRFLYRVKKFSEMFSDWFYIHNESKELLCRSKIHFVNNKSNKDKPSIYVLNTPSKERSNELSNQKVGSDMTSEHDLEVLFITKYKDGLLKKAKLSKLYRQLPIGVFEGKVSKGNAIFTGQHSAIDIWGISDDKKTLSIFELKKPENRAVGIVSELIFYSMVVKDILSERFIINPVDNNNSKIRDIIALKEALQHTKYIKAYFLVKDMHPLIKMDVIELLNDANIKNNISFDIISYDKDFKIK